MTADSSAVQVQSQNTAERPDLAELMVAFTQVATGVEDAHRALANRVEALVRDLGPGRGGAQGGTGAGADGTLERNLTRIPPCDGVITLEAIERQAVLVTLGRCGGHRQRTALALGIGVRTLSMKLRAWKDAGLVPETA